MLLAVNSMLQEDVDVAVPKKKPQTPRVRRPEGVVKASDAEEEGGSKTGLSIHHSVGMRELNGTRGPSRLTSAVTRQLGTYMTVLF